MVLERISRRACRWLNASRSTLAASLLIAPLICPPPADAGKYHVYSCRTPDGEAAPTEGWQGTRETESAPDTVTLDTCEQGGALIAGMGEETTHVAGVDEALWAFEAPPWAHIMGGRLWRAAYAHGREGERARYQFSIAAPTTISPLEVCSSASSCSAVGETSVPMAQANLLFLPATAGPGVFARVACGPAGAGAECGTGYSDPRGFAAAVYVFAADLVLEQESDPTVAGVAGELVSASSVAGTEDVSFAASDPGSGVYEAVFSVDGQVVQRTVLNENGGRCRNVGETSDGLPAFLYVQPCPSSVSADVGFDSSLVGDGSHHLVVSVIDAAGNAATVLDRQITVANPGAPGPPNGENATSQARLSVRWQGVKGTRLLSAFGRSHEVLGTLTSSSGAPIIDALVEASATPAGASAGAAARYSVRTNSAGEFRLAVPRGVSSRALRFVYRDTVNAPSPVATATLLLAVRAGVRLSISPHVASVGHRIHFTGRLLGGPVPREGKQLVLEARAPGGRWIEFDDVRTDSQGRYRASYRFRFPGPATYQFRVLSEPESDYPYSQGTSNTITIKEL